MPRLTFNKVFEKVCINQIEDYDEAIRIYEKLLPQAVRLYEDGSEEEDVMYEWCTSFLEVSKYVRQHSPISIAS